MKPMNDRRMDMNKGDVDSEAFFPESAQHKKMARAGEIRGFDYPDTEQAIERDQEQAVSATSRNLPKPNFRH